MQMLGMLLWLVSFVAFALGIIVSRELEEKKYRVLAYSLAVVFFGYSLGAWFLWDSADGWGDLAVVRNGQVVETGRTLVWTGDGTTTFVWYREIGLSLQQTLRDGWFVSVVVKPLELNALEAANRELVRKKTTGGVVFDHTLQSLALPTQAGQVSEELFRRDVTESFRRFGYTVVDFHAAKLPEQIAVN